MRKARPNHLRKSELFLAPCVAGDRLGKLHDNTADRGDVAFQTCGSLNTPSSSHLHHSTNPYNAATNSLFHR